MRQVRPKLWPRTAQLRCAANYREITRYSAYRNRLTVFDWCAANYCQFCDPAGAAAYILMPFYCQLTANEFAILTVLGAFCFIFMHLGADAKIAVNLLYKNEINAFKSGDPNGIRTRVTAVKGRCPRPLDDRV